MYIAFPNARDRMYTNLHRDAVLYVPRLQRGEGRIYAAFENMKANHRNTTLPRALWQQHQYTTPAMELS